jgi:hypothetical protein
MQNTILKHQFNNHFSRHFPALEVNSAQYILCISYLQGKGSWTLTRRFLVGLLRLMCLALNVVILWSGCCKTRATNLSSSTNTTVVLLFASEHRHNMSSRTSTVYKYVKEHYPVSKQQYGVREHQFENPWCKTRFLRNWDSSGFFVHPTWCVRFT